MTMFDSETLEEMKSYTMMEISQFMNMKYLKSHYDEEELHRDLLHYKSFDL